MSNWAQMMHDAAASCLLDHGDDDMLDAWAAMVAVRESPIAGVPFAAWCAPLNVRAVPIVLEGDSFVIHPAGRLAPSKAWRAVIAVRDGPPSWADYERAIAGDLVDLAAVSLSGDKVIATMSGTLRAIGVSEFEPSSTIHLRPSPAAWLRDCRGAVLARPLAQSIDFLRGFQTIVTDSIEHGEAVQSALRRAYRGPDIRVAA